MNVLDENIPDSQRQLLRGWRIRVRQIGHEIGRQGIKDPDLVRLLARLKAPTFFTRDLRFYEPRLCDARYCLVVLAVEQHEAASFIRRILRHPAFDTRAKRMGAVVRATHAGIRMWRTGSSQEQSLRWLTLVPRGR